MELLINSNSNSWEILLTIAIAIVPKMSIAIVISILLISSGRYPCILKESSTLTMLIAVNSMIMFLIILLSVQIMI